MWKRAALFFIVIAPTLAGIGMLVALVAFGNRSVDPLILLGCIAAGAVLAFPVSYLVAKRISHLIERNGRLAA